MNEKDVEKAINGIADFIGLLWTKVIIPVINGIGALFDMLPPVAIGIIAGVLGVVYLFRRARRG